MGTRNLLNYTFLKLKKKKKKKGSMIHGRLVFVNVLYRMKNLLIQDRAVYMGEEKKGLILFFLFLKGEREIGIKLTTYFYFIYLFFISNGNPLIRPNTDGVYNRTPNKKEQKINLKNLHN